MANSAGSPRLIGKRPWNGGRNHWGSVFSALLAGGGFKGGQVIGSSDAKGEQVKDRPVYPADLISSIYEQMGIDPGGQAASSPGAADSVVTPTAADGLPLGGRLEGDHVMGRVFQSRRLRRAPWQAKGILRFEAARHRLKPVLLFAFAATLAAQPHAGYIYPAGGQEGTSVEVRLGGAGLSTVDKAYISGQGVAVKIVEYVKIPSGKEMQFLREEMQKLNEKRAASYKRPAAGADKDLLRTRISKASKRCARRRTCGSAASLFPPSPIL